MRSNEDKSGADNASSGDDVEIFETLFRQELKAMKNKDKITTFLGEGTEFEGILECAGALRIDGHFRGEISGEMSLVVGEGAKIESDIHVSHLLNSGEIKGSVVAKERIEIREPGKVLGNIRTPSLVMDEGAIMEGKCRMHRTGEMDE